MTAQEQRKHLEEQLEKVKQRLQLLDMMEEKLIQMKQLAQKRIEKDVTVEQIQKMNDQVRNLEKQVRLLDSESTKLS
ncbi:hypothetical protein QBE52_03180 [Clostridiaceae bacterium 35-E11]